MLELAADCNSASPFASYNMIPYLSYFLYLTHEEDHVKKLGGRVYRHVERTED